METEELIKDLERKIQDCVWCKEDLDSASWAHEEGVLITAAAAKHIVEILKQVLVSNEEEIKP